MLYLLQKYTKRGQLIINIFNLNIKNIIRNIIVEDIEIYKSTISINITKEKSIDTNKFYFYDTEINLSNIEKYTIKQLERRCLMFNDRKLRIVRMKIINKIPIVYDKKQKKDLNIIKPLKMKIEPSILNYFNDIILKRKNQFKTSVKLVTFFELNKTEKYSFQFIKKKIKQIIDNKILTKHEIESILNIQNNYLHGINYPYREDYFSKKNDYYVKLRWNYAIKHNLKVNKIYKLSKCIDITKNDYYYSNLETFDFYYMKRNIIKKIIKIQKCYKTYKIYKNK